MSSYRRNSVNTDWAIVHHRRADPQQADAALAAEEDHHGGWLYGRRVPEIVVGDRHSRHLALTVESNERAESRNLPLLRDRVSSRSGIDVMDSIGYLIRNRRERSFCQARADFVSTLRSRLGS